MKCKLCGMILSPDEETEILTHVVDGIVTERICEDCYNEMEGREMGSQDDRYNPDIIT